MPNPKVPEFLQIEKEFAAYLRDPENNPKPSAIDAEQINIYQSLIFNNISEMLANCFPVIFSILEGLQWQQLIRAFLSEHQAVRPLFVELPLEFLTFLEIRHPSEKDYPFLLELAHYEWIELELDIAEEKAPPHPLLDKGNYLTGIPQMSPFVRILHYQHPVQKIGKDYLPSKPSPVHLIVYRDQNENIKFFETNAASARLLELLSTEPGMEGQAALKQIAEELHHPKPEAIISFGQDMLQQFLELGIIIGVRA